MSVQTCSENHTAAIRLLYVRLRDEDATALNHLSVHGFLSAYELQRLATFERADLRQQWLLARALREFAFRKYWQLANPPLRLSVNGKPELSDGIACVSRHFNLTHHSQMIAVALTDVPVGVDVEMQQRRIKRERLLAKHFSAQEALSINASAEPDKQLLAHWCIKEAYLKARGAKIAGAALDNMTVELAPMTGVSAMVQTAELPFAPDYCAQLWAVDDSLLAVVAKASCMKVIIERVSVNEIVATLAS